jgi:N utilization substance protein A
VRPIINELQGERIDLVAYSNDNATFIGNALAPVKPISVTILSQSDKRAEVLVSDDQLSLAIGRGGQNVSLAARLTGWQIDVRSQGQKKEAAAASMTSLVPLDELSQGEGVDSKTAEVLHEEKCVDVPRLGTVEPEVPAVPEAPEVECPSESREESPS